MPDPIMAGASALAGGVTGLVGAKMGADASKAASGQQKKAADATLALQREMYNKQVQDFSPYLQAGNSALARLQKMNGGGGIADDAKYNQYLAELERLTSGASLTGSNIYDNPIYNFQRDEANKQLSRSLRSMGRENSTYGMDAMGKQSNRLAADQYQNINNTQFARTSGLAATRYSTLADQYNRLRDLASSGQSAAGLSGNAAANYSQNAGATLTNLGNSQANNTLAGGMMQAGAIQNGINNTATLFGTGMKAYDALNKGSGLYGADWKPEIPQMDTSFLNFKPA